MNNLKLMPGVRKSICPNCGEDLIVTNRNDVSCPNCDNENIPLGILNSTQKESNSEFVELVIQDAKALRSHKNPYLRTPEVAVRWLNVLQETLDGLNDRIGALNMELKSTNDPNMASEISNSLKKSVWFRSSIRSSIFEAQRTLGKQEVPTDTTLQLKLAREKITRLEKHAKSLEEQLKNNLAKGPVAKKLENQVAHAYHLQVQAGFYRYGLRELKTLLESGVTDSEMLLKTVNYRLDQNNLDNYLEGSTGVKS